MKQHHTKLPAQKPDEGLCDIPKQTSNQKSTTGQKVFYLIVVLLSLLYLFAGYKISSDRMPHLNNDTQVESIPARVTEILDESTEENTIGDTNYHKKVITFSAEILSGSQKGKTVTAIQNLDNMSSHGVIPIEKGNKIFLVGTNPKEGIVWEAGDFHRSNGIFLLGGVFLLGLIFFGRSKGVKTILSLVFTCLAIFMVFIPSILAGYNIYGMAVITCLFVIAMTLALVSGPRRQSLSAALGCAGGVMVAGLLTVIMDHALKLTGYLDEESVYLVMLNDKHPIDLRGVIFASIIIGAVGATMDVAMDISSSLFEIHRKAPELPFNSLIHSGFTIGRDIMGTMANTLILAYIGSSLSSVLLFASYQTSLETLLNRELIIVEMLQALCGSIGILCTIPISAAVAATLCYVDYK